MDMMPASLGLMLSNEIFDRKQSTFRNITEEFIQILLLNTLGEIFRNALFRTRLKIYCNKLYVIVLIAMLRRKDLRMNYDLGLKIDFYGGYSIEPGFSTSLIGVLEEKGTRTVSGNWVRDEMSAT